MQVELLKLQEWLKKTGKTIIIVFEGRDSAGKGSTIKKFVENLNPRYYNIVALGVPTPEDRKDWWGRYRNQIKPGMINLFERSWYNRGLIEPVMGYGSPEEYEGSLNIWYSRLRPFNTKQSVQKKVQRRPIKILMRQSADRNQIRPASRYLPAFDK